MFQVRVYHHLTGNHDSLNGGWLPGYGCSWCLGWIKRSTTYSSTTSPKCSAINRPDSSAPPKKNTHTFFPRGTNPHFFGFEIHTTTCNTPRVLYAGSRFFIWGVRGSEPHWGLFMTLDEASQGRKKPWETKKNHPQNQHSTRWAPSRWL